MRHSFKGFVAALAMSAGLTTSVMAEVVSTQPLFTKEGSGITIIPGDYLADGRPQIMISDIDSLRTTVRLYGVDFAELGDVVVPHSEPLRSEVQETRSLSYSWPMVTKTKLLEDMPLSEAENYIRSVYGYGEIETKESDGGTDIYLNNEQCVFATLELPGVGVDHIYKVWFRFEPYDAEHPENNGVLYSFEGEGEAPTVTPGEWEVADYYEKVMYPFGEVSFISDKGTHADCSLALTQTLFNEDDGYEYITRDYELRVADVYEAGPTISGEKIPVYRSTRCDVVCSGFSVKAADGSTIQSVKFPEDFYSAGTLKFRVLELDDRRYLCCESPYEIIIYAINGNGAGLRQVGSSIAARVFPTIVSRGEPLSIERDDESEEARVSVYSGDGVRRYYGGMQAGEQLKTLPTAGLPGGLNIVTIENGSHRESTKVLVK